METQVMHCLLRVLSPVHVGCDEVYEPTGFVVDREKNHLVVFDPTTFIAELPEEDRQRFSGICRKGTVASIVEIYRFMKDKPAEGRRVDLCRGFPAHMEKVLNLQLNDKTKGRWDELNRFQIERTAFNPNDGRPYIPGSAVKGALRTAWLNQAASKSPGVKTRERNGQKDRMTKDAENLEKALLKIQDKFIEKDPFRLVKVSDFQPVGRVDARVCYAVNRKKQTGGREDGGLSPIMEVVRPGSEFVGTIRVEQPHRDAKIYDPLDLAELMKSLVFFDTEKQREDRELADIGVSPVERRDGDAGNLLRVGRHSGAESITIEGHRRIAIMTGRNKYDISEKGATTLWLASESSQPDADKNLEPFGWATMHPLSPDEVRNLEQRESRWRADREIIVAERLDRQRNERERRIEKKRRHEAARAADEEEKRLRQEAEARRRAEIEAMTPAQKDAAILDDPNILPQQVWSLYGRLETYEGEDRLILAGALKKHFLAKGKWTRKQCSPKEWKKIREIKSILGEG